MARREGDSGGGEAEDKEDGGGDSGKAIEMRRRERRLDFRGREKRPISLIKQSGQDESGADQVGGPGSGDRLAIHRRGFGQNGDIPKDLGLFIK
ncbi:UNVERIFIED_CONTAM: hypothetical protein Sradi_1505000 [Sesamum radiatum]|uniref:Uncharacterized protein n=1 Tax=Sesamum radiatum TaxID=300843 RepID=A0AAW2U846_SESRA